MTEKKCTHCYCIEKDDGLNGPKCQEPHDECCKCGGKRARPAPLRLPMMYPDTVPRRHNKYPKGTWMTYTNTTEPACATCKDTAGNPIAH